MILLTVHNFSILPDKNQEESGNPENRHLKSNRRHEFNENLTNSREQNTFLLNVKKTSKHEVYFCVCIFFFLVDCCLSILITLSISLVK